LSFAAALAQHDYSRHLLRAAMAARDADLVQEPVVTVRPAVAAPRPEGPPVLEIERLVKRFPVKGGRVLTAVNDVSLTIGRGEAVGLVGESGSGKTTVGRCILRLLEPSSGTVRFVGRDISILPQNQFRRLRSRIQMVFQDPFDSVDPRQRISDALEEPCA
jgi:ABC-type glutathione transport system ATPase component